MSSRWSRLDRTHADVLEAAGGRGRSSGGDHERAGTRGGDGRRTRAREEDGAEGTCTDAEKACAYTWRIRRSLAKERKPDGAAERVERTGEITWPASTAAVSVLSCRTKPQKRQRCHSPRDSLEPLVSVKKVRTRGGDGDVEPPGLAGDGKNA